MVQVPPILRSRAFWRENWRSGVATFIRAIDSKFRGTACLPWGGSRAWRYEIHPVVGSATTWEDVHGAARILRGSAAISK
jgi:hypothetical protein